MELKKILLLLLFLIFVTNFSFAEAMESQIALEKYLESGYNETNLSQRNTVLKFQAENNLTVDGVIGDLTIEALANENKNIVDIVPDEIVKKDWFVVINKSKKILTVYKNGEVYKKYPIALGKSNSPTPNHKFTIINKVKNPHWGGMGGRFKPVKGGAPNNPLGKRWMGLSTEKYRGYGIHGNSQPFSIGNYASAGCIRMINEDVRELFEYLPIKANVWIGTEEFLEKWGIKQYIEYEEVQEIEEVC